MRIGNVTLATNLLLCPIAGYTDLAFRLGVRPLGGLGLAFTDLVNPQGLKRQTRRSMQIVRTHPDDQPLGIQLYGTDAEDLAEAAAWAADNGAAIVDINMGCPVPKVAGLGGGCGLLRTPDHAVQLARLVVERCPVPVTVKTRLGWTMGRVIAPDMARRFEDVGVAAITIHGRFGEQAFRGDADWNAIRAVVAAVRHIPVIGNGDVRSPQDARRMLSDVGCAGVMIGRRALADQWIFRDAHALLATGVLPPPPSRLERCEWMVGHFRRMIEYLGDRVGVAQFRRRAPWHAKTLAPCPALRRGLPQIRSIADFDAMVEPFLAELRAGDDERPANANEFECVTEAN